ncbi:MAG: hypothetical protein M0Z78_05320 [Betaproteobacteria bacterium]|jgi:hypothetical protein|nr:hypothetical protein [Betaproteobacteria bacterium]
MVFCDPLNAGFGGVHPNLVLRFEPSIHSWQDQDLKPDAGSKWPEKRKNTV